MSRKKVSPLAGKKATVYLERNGLTIRVDDVDAETAGLVAADMLEAVRLLTKTFPELIPELQPVAGYAPLDTSDDEWQDDGRKRTGFRA